MTPCLASLLFAALPGRVRELSVFANATVLLLFAFGVDLALTPR